VGPVNSSGNGKCERASNAGEPCECGKCGHQFLMDESHAHDDSHNSDHGALFVQKADAGSCLWPCEANHSLQTPSRSEPHTCAREENIRRRSAHMDAQRESAILSLGRKPPMDRQAQTGRLNDLIALFAPVDGSSTHVTDPKEPSPRTRR
jgi:hypothetical protein